MFPTARGSKAWWGSDMCQFKVGEVVTCCVRYSAPGAYKIIAFMPDQDGEHMYRIKSPLEEYERVVKENTLAWSEDVLPDALPDAQSRQRRVGRRNITLPTLVPSVAPSTAAEWDQKPQKNFLWIHSNLSARYCRTAASAIIRRQIARLSRRSRWPARPMPQSL